MEDKGHPIMLVPGSTGVVAYSAGTSAFGGALAVVVVWLISILWKISVPNDVAMAFVVLFTTITSFVLRYLPQPARGQSNGETGSKS